MDAYPNGCCLTDLTATTFFVIELIIIIIIIIMAITPSLSDSYTMVRIQSSTISLSINGTYMVTVTNTGMLLNS